MALVMAELRVGSLICPGEWLCLSLMARSDTLLDMPHRRRRPEEQHGCQGGCTQGGRVGPCITLYIGWTRASIVGGPGQYNGGQINNISLVTFRQSGYFLENYEIW